MRAEKNPNKVRTLRQRTAAELLAEVKARAAMRSRRAVQAARKIRLGVSL